MSRMTRTCLCVCTILAALAAPPVWAQTAESAASTASVPATGTSGPQSWSDPAGLLDQATKPERLSSTLEILLLITVLSLVPAILVMTTCFTRIVVVLALLRQAMATQQLPPTQVITGLALFMTLAVMGPTWSRINTYAIAPYVSPAQGEQAITLNEAWGRAKTAVRAFMISQIEHTGSTEDVYMFMEYNSPSQTVQAKLQDESLQWQDVPMTSLIPAFMTSELKQAFVMGFYIYLPFLIIDMVIASILISMGMMMLPPVLISLPFKLLLFVLVDGWQLVVGSLLQSFVHPPW